MNAKNRLILFIIVLAGWYIAIAGENNSETQDMNVLKTKIAELEKTINDQAEQIRQTEKKLDELRKQLELLVEENNRLREICKKSGIETTKKYDTVPKSIGRIVYRGKERDEDWFNRMYKQFSEKIALVGDKYVDLRTVKPNYISSHFVEIGNIVELPKIDCRQEVISVMGNDEALIHCRFYRVIQNVGVQDTGPGYIYHLCGYDHPLIDGESLNIDKLICIGTYEYTTTTGAKKTVQSFKVWEPKPLTKEQFAEVLRSKFVLINYVERNGKTVEVPIR